MRQDTNINILYCGNIYNMVQSKLHQSIQYVESNLVDDDEFGHDSAAYKLDLFPGNFFIVAIGKKRDNYSHYNVFYFPIYLVGNNNKIKSKIGVFEVEAKKVLNVYDEDDDVDLEKLDEPLLFKNVTKEYIEEYGVLVEDEEYESKDNEIDEKKTEETIQKISEGDDEDEDEDDEDKDMFTLKPDKQKDEQKNETKEDIEQSEKNPEKKYMTIDDVFIKESTLPSQITFPAETEEDAKKFVSDYKEKKAATDNWIQQLMKNKEYEILRNEGGGDCLFASIRDAYTQIGYNTTVAKLRQFLSQEATQDMMEQYELLYKDYDKEIDFLEAEMDKSKKMMTSLKKQSKKTTTKGGQKEIIDEAKNLQVEYDGFKSKIDNTKELLKEVQFMKSIETLDQFKEFIKSSDFWADTWAISTLERLLNMKIIIMEKSEDDNASLLCGQMNDTDEMYSKYDPQYYIVVSKTDEHYELVSYRKKKMLTFAEVPYGLKFKVVEKCMERNAGLYAMLPAFKQFQMDMGRQPITSKKDGPMPQDEEGLYDKEVVFQFHQKAAHKKPGRGTGEQIETIKEKGKRLKVSQREMDFDKLQKIENWRQKLSDTWTMAPFEVNDKKWSSVSHYLLALPFEKEYPEIYNEFSLNSNSDMSKNLEKAEESIEKKKKNKIGKHYEVYKTLNETKDDVLQEERKKALRAKFTGSGDMTTLLNETKDAKLVIYRHKQEPKVDVDLMLLRKEIQDL